MNILRKYGKRYSVQFLFNIFSGHPGDNVKLLVFELKKIISFGYFHFIITVYIVYNDIVLRSTFYTELAEFESSNDGLMSAVSKREEIFQLRELPSYKHPARQSLRNQFSVAFSGQFGIN